MAAQRFGHENLFGPIRLPDLLNLEQAQEMGLLNPVDIPQSVGRAVRRDDHEAADSDHIPETFQINAEQIQRNLNLLPLFGISPNNLISGSAPQTPELPESVYVHDTTAGGSLIEEVIPVGKVDSQAVTPLFEIVSPTQQPQQQGENS